MTHPRFGDQTPTIKYYKFSQITTDYYRIDNPVELPTEKPFLSEGKKSKFQMLPKGLTIHFFLFRVVIPIGIF